MKTSIFFILLLSLSGCASIAKKVDLTPAGSKVIISQADPGPQFISIGAISVEHGHGCGGYGKIGTLEGAYNSMKNKAAEMGADYVQIIHSEPPHNAHIFCYDDRYQLDGMAYKKKN